MTRVESLAIDNASQTVTLDQAEANRWPIITEEDEQAVLRVLRDGDLSTHPVTRELEHDYCNYFGVRHALSHCNGTSALMAAFFALDLQPCDEVIVPSATWWSSVSPLLWIGAVPVFAESEMDRLGLDPIDVEAKITPRTKAIVVVHLWGMPSKMTELLAIAKRHDLAVVEDASHAHGATWHGRKCGTLGDVAVFSLQGHKLAPAGEGGILLTDRDDLMERAMLLGDVGRIRELTTAARRFAATSFGIKTRLAPMSAAVAQVQFRHLDARNKRRNENIEYLSHHLENVGVHTFRSPAHVKRVYFEFLVRVDQRPSGMSMDDLLAALKAEGCHVRPARYPLLHQQPFFTEGHAASIARLPADVEPPVYRPDALPRLEQANGQLLALPSFPQAERPLLDQYASAFRKVLRA